MLPAIHCSFLSTATFKMASEALMAKKGRGVMDRKCFTLASKCSDKLFAFPNKDEWSCFPSDTGGFSPISKVGIQCLVSTMYYSILCVAKKFSVLLMVFLVIRDVLFRQNILFPITFFAVYTRSLYLVILHTYVVQYSRSNIGGLYYMCRNLWSRSTRDP